MPTTRRPFDRFILLASMRTGSNFLEANLNAIPGIHCHGEAYNPGFIASKADGESYLDFTLADRDRDPMALRDAIEASTDGIAGFRFFHDHDMRMLAASLADPRCAKIVLTRNPLESHVSLLIARATGQWRMADGRRRREAKVRFEAEAFEDHLRIQQDFQLHIMRELQASGQAAFWIDYEDINDLAVINGLAHFLGVEGRLEALDDSVKKQNPEAIEDLLENPEDLAPALARLDRFNLSRTPNFEPRRPPGIPGWMAAAGAGLLYMPVRGGLEDRIAAWLSGLGRKPGLISRFNQKELRAWLAANPGARSFTVIRHPLVRAHDAFRSRILSGDAGELRGQLKRQWKLDLPHPDRIDRMSAEDQAEAFSGFLRFLKANVAGQSLQRIDPSWAGQLSTIQGLSSHMPPEIILREDRLIQGLAFLAAELGLSKVPPLPEGAALPGLPLEAILRPEHQQAAREAYPRDFQAWGFGDWVPEGSEAG